MLARQTALSLHQVHIVVCCQVCLQTSSSYRDAANTVHGLSFVTPQTRLEATCLRASGCWLYGCSSAGPPSVSQGLACILHLKLRCKAALLEMCRHSDCVYACPVLPRTSPGTHSLRSTRICMCIRTFAQLHVCFACLCSLKKSTHLEHAGLLVPHAWCPGRGCALSALYRRVCTYARTHL